MIILDTNVVSEPLRPAPDPAVLAWLDRQAPESLYLTTINLAELLAGIELLPAGKRRTDLKLALLGRMLPLFDQRLLSFDSSAAEAFAQINALAQAAGSPVSFADGAIAAIAAARGFMIATRNVRDFNGTGVKIVNPWTD
jgi:predicted nucleic acid-binding protein